jgi:hypothetical protein
MLNINKKAYSCQIPQRALTTSSVTPESDKHLLRSPTPKVNYHSQSYRAASQLPTFIHQNSDRIASPEHGYDKFCRQCSGTKHHTLPYRPHQLFQSVR